MPNRSAIPKKKAVLLVSTSYPASLEDWRGLFIRHLVDALARRNALGVQLWAPPGQTHPEVESIVSERDSHFLKDLMQRGGIAHLLRTNRASAAIVSVRLLAALRMAYRRADRADLYHINWLQNALPLPHDGKPLLVSVLGTDMQLLKKPLMKSLLRRVFSRHPTVIGPNAEWMVPELTDAFGDIAEIRFVPFGIDPVWYAVKRPAQPQGPARWLAVTRLTRAKLGPLFAWGEPLFRGQSRELHLFGPMQEKMAIPEWIRYHGPASPDTLCRDWFPLAHGLITLSNHAEGRPQVMLEAMASGLPILASRLPAHENLIEHGTTGWLCERAEDVGAGLTHLEKWPANLGMGGAARLWVNRAVGTWDDCGARYEAVYQQLLGGAAR